MEPEENTRFAWEPVTPAGVAAFADASLRRLWLVQLLVAIFCAAAVLWFMYTGWFPVIQSGIRQLPSRGAIRFGRLQWQGENPAKLADNHFLGFTVDLRHEGSVRSPAHLEAQFGEKEVVLWSLFGALDVPYPRGYAIAFNRDELEPWWGAWSPAILAISAGAVVAGLMLSWAMLALLYSIVAWLTAFFANRKLGVVGSYRLCGAALMPGALIMIIAIVVYGLGGLDIVRLLITFAAHLVLGWAYVIASVFWRPKVLDLSVAKGNPFGNESAKSSG